MGDTPIETVETLLESVLEETDDATVHYKLRTALQLLTVIRDRAQTTQDILENTEMDDDVRRRLRELGYLDQ